jgi:hypothetical protein
MIVGRITIALALLSMGVSGSLRAMEIVEADSQYRDRHYHLRLILVLDAPPDKVQAVLRDYANYPRLDARILEASVTGRPGQGELFLYTKLRACFGVICRNVKRVERVHEGENDLRAIVMPDLSDANSGETHTQLTALDGRTRVSYTTSIVPGFWIPSVIGRPLMLRTLRDASVDLFSKVEQRARTLVIEQGHAK